MRSGSVLIFALIALGLVLTTALSLSVLTVSGSRTSISTNKSVVALQWADTGIELALQKIYKDDEDVRGGAASAYSDLDDFANAFGTSVDCASSIIALPPSSGAEVELIFRDGDGELIACGDADWRDLLGGVIDQNGDPRDPGDPTGSVTVRATYEDTVRAVNVKVLPVQ